MKRLFYYPNEGKISGVAVFYNMNTYYSVYHFLKAIEYLESQVKQDLKELFPLYEEALRLKEAGLIEGWVEWDTISSANESHNPLLIPLQEALKSWGRKYHLVDNEWQHTLYLEVATSALCRLSSHDEKVAQFTQIYKDQGRPIPEWVTKWFLHDAIYFEMEEDPGLNDMDTGALPFDELYPFAFNPERSCNCFWPKLETNKESPEEHSAECFETLLQDQKQKVFIIKNDMSDRFRDVTHTWSGEGWDPRIETWQEFEQRIDEMFVAYKKAYRKRTEQFMTKLGYVEGPEKRNLEHFLWLVRYQVQGWKMSKIADYYSKSNKIITEDAVSKALHKTAPLVGIVLRSTYK